MTSSSISISSLHPKSLYFPMIEPVPILISGVLLSIKLRQKKCTFLPDVCSPKCLSQILPTYNKRPGIIQPIMFMMLENN